MNQQARRVMERFEALAALSEEPDRLTRPSFTPALRRAHEQTAIWMREAGMTVREDAIGNLVGCYPADHDDAPVLLLGSHLDTVRNAGKYDGTLGVLVPIACVAQVHQHGRRLPFAVEVVAFVDEEGLRFHTSFLGSRAFAGRFDQVLLDVTDAEGTTVAEAIRAFGGDPAQLDQVAVDPATLIGYCELHIEQGPVLQARDLPVGVVTAIAGRTRARVQFVGTAGHAGTVPMDLRRDALAAAAEFVLAVEAVGRDEPGLVATVGEVAVEPGANNVIPGAVTLSLDVRHQQDDVREAAVATLHQHLHAIAARRMLDAHWTHVQDGPAMPCSPALRQLLGAAISAAGYPVHELPSGAGHDAAVLAEIAPMAMLFVRCRDGISHNPLEAISAADVAVAINVLSHFFDLLAQPEARQ